MEQLADALVRDVVAGKVQDGHAFELLGAVHKHVENGIAHLRPNNMKR